MTLFNLIEHSGRPTQQYYLPAEKRISGNPLQSLWLNYQDLSRAFSIGHWHSEVGKWSVQYTEEE